MASSHILIQISVTFLTVSVVSEAQKSTFFPPSFLQSHCCWQILMDGLQWSRHGATQPRLDQSLKLVTSALYLTSFQDDLWGSQSHPFSQPSIRSKCSLCIFQSENYFALTVQSALKLGRGQTQKWACGDVAEAFPPGTRLPAALLNSHHSYPRRTFPTFLLVSQLASDRSRIQTWNYETLMSPKCPESSDNHASGLRRRILRKDRNKMGRRSLWPMHPRGTPPSWGCSVVSVARGVVFQNMLRFQISQSMEVRRIRISRRDSNKLVVGGHGLGHDGPRYWMGVWLLFNSTAQSYLIFT